MPRGAQTSYSADPGTDLEVMTGFALQGAQ